MSKEGTKEGTSEGVEQSKLDTITSRNIMYVCIVMLNLKTPLLRDKLVYSR